MEPSTPPIVIADNGDLKKAISDLKKEWRRRYKKKRPGKKSVEAEAMAAISAAYLELRHGHMTQYNIRQRAFKKNPKIQEPTYKKYAQKFVALLAAVADPNQLSDLDRKLIDKGTPVLARKVADYRNILAMAADQATMEDVSPAESSEPLAEATLIAIEEIRKVLSAQPQK